MSDCLFCKIANKEIPSNIVYEDEKVMAFLDINPVHPGHTLVVPKNHSETIFDTDEEILKSLIAVVKKVAEAVRLATGSDGLNIIQNNFKAGHQVIPHIHFHIIPRFEGDGLKTWPQKPYENEDQVKEIEKRIKNNLL
jgi:histidine triad (HIT) family protein